MEVDWSKTKTIFIITFLVLDLFLIYQFIEKRNLSQLDLIREASIEEQLETEEITYVQLPKLPDEGDYIIYGKAKAFTIDEVKGLKNQDINLEEPKILKSTFIEPVKFSEDNVDTKVVQFVKENIAFGSSYLFWNYDKETKSIILFQHYKNNIFFNNPNNFNGLVLLQFNENNELISYVQTLLTDIEEYEREEMLTSIQAIEHLYKSDYLPSGSEVTRIEFGYYPLVKLSESQVLTPTWHIIVDDKTDYYVNAIEGQIIEIQE
jgi:regulatory protein YycI of two-component signal transduction system YycFG